MPILARWEESPYTFNVYSAMLLAHNPHFSANIGAPTLKDREEWTRKRLIMATQNNPYLYNPVPMYRARSKR